MNTLYVSDLDGTLFNSNKEITLKTVSLLNACIERGMKFTVATARMPYDCDDMLSKVNLQVPGVLTNGVFLYNFNMKRFEMVESISKDSVKNCLNILGKYQIPCFVYTYHYKENISMYYQNEDQKAQTQYYSERALQYCTEVSITSNILNKTSEKDIIYLAATGQKEIFTPPIKELDLLTEISHAFYLNIYNDLYCLEIFSKKASKKNAIKKLMEIGNYDELVVFGDNLNDLSMFEIANYSYAPSNALPEVCERATKVIDSNDEDGVAIFLANKFGIA